MVMGGLKKEKWKNSIKEKDQPKHSTETSTELGKNEPGEKERKEPERLLSVGKKKKKVKDQERI